GLAHAALPRGGAPRDGIETRSTPAGALDGVPGHDAIVRTPRTSGGRLVLHAVTLHTNMKRRHSRANPLPGAHTRDTVFRIRRSNSTAFPALRVQPRTRCAAGHRTRILSTLGAPRQPPRAPHPGGSTCIGVCCPDGT